MKIRGAPNASILRMETVFRPLIRAGMASNVAVIIVGSVAVLALISVLYWFFGAELGSAVGAIGNNQKMMRAQEVKKIAFV